MNDLILKFISACHTGIGKRGVLGAIFSTHAHGTGGLWSTLPSKSTCIWVLSVLILYYKINNF